MPPLEYYRPSSLEEALALLQHGVPLAGGTALTANRRALGAVVDLQDLGLDSLDISESGFRFGATLPLQALVAAAERLPPALVRACRLEAGWNIRNQATLGGTLFSGDGRSPLLTTLLAMGAELESAQSNSRLPLAELLSLRANGSPIGLITSVHINRPRRLAYEQVARSPADLPQVCAAAAHFDGTDQLGVALGGFGRHPLLVHQASGGQARTLERAVEAARQAFSKASDAWAGAEFRAAVAGTLVGRVVREVVTR
ncbi:MAG TPA: FAD binding domain-containing protein [Anaerolineales bacterium]